MGTPLGRAGSGVGLAYGAQTKVGADVAFDKDSDEAADGSVGVLLGRSLHGLDDGVGVDPSGFGVAPSTVADLVQLGLDRIIA